MQYMRNKESHIRIGDMFLCINENKAIMCRLCMDKIKKGEYCLHRYVSRGNFNIHIHHLNEQLQNEIRVMIL